MRDRSRQTRAARVRAARTGADRDELQEFGAEHGETPVRRDEYPRTKGTPPDAFPDTVLLFDAFPFRWKQLAFGVTLVAAGFATTVIGVTLLRAPWARTQQPAERATATIPAPDSKPVDRTMPVQPPVARPVPAERPVPVGVVPPRAERNLPAAPRPRTFVAVAAPRATEPAAPARAPTPPPVAQPPLPVAAPAVAAAPPVTAPAAPAIAPTFVPETARAPTEAIATAAPVARPAAREAERNAIQILLSRYRNAYNTLDASEASAVWPTVNEKTLAKAFERIEAQDVSFDDCRIEVGGVAAEAACTGTASYVPKVGSKTPRAENRQWTFNLRKAGAGWVIDRVEMR